MVSKQYVDNDYDKYSCSNLSNSNYDYLTQNNKIIIQEIFNPECIFNHK